MPRARAVLAILVFIPIVFAAPVRTAEQTLVAPGALWKYSDTNTNLGTTWRGTSFNDSSWPAGIAQLGYGDGDEATVLSFGPDSANKTITYYFRHRFTVTNPAGIAALTLRFLRDDGCVIYLNGQEIIRSNMPSGPIAHTTLAATAIGGADENLWHQTAVDPSLLVAGANVIAVEVHQQSVVSTDVSFDLELRATETQPPAATVALLSPPNQSISNTASVIFTASATATAGLSSATLFAGGPPQSVTFSGPAQVEDAQIDAGAPTVANGTGLSINVDGQTPHAHGLMKFPTLIGSLGSQIPPGAVIVSATLQLNCTNAGNVMALYRLTQSWVENEASWTNRSNGVAWAAPGADGPGSNAQMPIAADCTTTGTRLVDITRFVQEWSDGSPNYGFVIADSGADGVDFDSSESATSPVLTVMYKSSQAPVAAQPLSGTSANIEFPVTLQDDQTYHWNVRVTDSLGRTSFAPADFVLTVDAGAPNEPVLVAPPEGATGVNPATALSAMVSNPGGGQVTASFALRRAAAPEFTIIVLPDTQHYSEAFPAVFTSQTQWIVNNKAARNIVFVTHEGDVVQNAGVVAEWDNANASMSLLDGVVPYGIGPGNHDQPTTLFNQYFPFTRYLGLPWYGGHFGALNDNNFQLFSGGGLDFVIVHLEFCPPAAAVSWGDSVFKAHPNRIGIMTTHGYLNGSAQRSVHSCSSTQYLWDGIAVPNGNVHFMLSGHVHDEARRSDVVNGHPVYQMLADYQDRAQGGEGWLRILRFVPADDRVYVQTYSPWLNRFETDANSEFTLDFPMGGAFAPAGTSTVASGATASVTPGTLQPNTRYEWRVTVTNANGRTRTGPTWTFTTGSAPVNQPPVAANQSVNVTEDTPTAIVLGATDPENAPLTFGIVSAPAHGTLTGTAPNVTYHPTANYSGPDSFTFRASDGSEWSNVAMVSIAVSAVNDPPVAVADTYGVQSGSVLTVAAPGVLANDLDIDSPALSAQLVSGAASGVVTLNANGSFTYTPSAGFAGTDAFVYRASDGATLSAPATVTISVTASPAPITVFAASFNAGADSFVYLDDTFRGTNRPGYASGMQVTSGGFVGGALRVDIGGVDNKAVTNMSGGWRRTFTLTAPGNAFLTFRYNMNQGADYESDELSQVLVNINGALAGVAPNDFVAQVIGNGNGGAAITTGWQLVEIPLGLLPAGTHNVILGGFNNRKNGTSERTTILIDDVTVVVR